MHAPSSAGAAKAKSDANLIDFDFGMRGEIDAFDSRRLVKFAGPELEKYGFETKNAIN